MGAILEREYLGANKLRQLPGTECAERNQGVHQMIFNALCTFDPLGVVANDKGKIRMLQYEVWLQESKDQKDFESHTCQNEKEELTQRKLAIKKFIENVSISGLMELYYSPTTFILILWIISMLAGFGSIIYHSTILTQLHINQNPSYDLVQTDRDVIPFPKITVCSPTGVNKSWTKENLSLPPKEKKIFDNLTAEGKDDYVEAMAALQGVSLEFIYEESFGPNSPRYFNYHHTMIKTHVDSWKASHWYNLSTSGIMPLCDTTVSNCRLAGRDFNCCSEEPQIFEEGPCYDLGVDKMDSTLNRPRLFTHPVSFTFDLKLDLNYMTKYSVFNGFSVVLAESLTKFANPIAVPAGTHAMISLANPVLRRDASLCLEGPVPDLDIGEYDRKGDLCKNERYEKEMGVPILSCEFPFVSYKPDLSVACTGAQVMPLKVMISNVGGGDETDEAQNRFTDKFVRQFREIAQSKEKCLPLCNGWQFTPTVSYFQILTGNNSEPSGGQDSSNISYSKVTVFIGEPYYTENEEIELQSIYALFLAIMEIFGLNFGCSVITFAEIAFWSVNVCLASLKPKGDKD